MNRRPLPVATQATGARFPVLPFSPDQSCTTKQIGDAAEYLTAGLMMLAGGIPTFMVPGNWPDYDLVAEPKGRQMQRISVKSCRDNDKKPGPVWKPGDWDWAALVWIVKTGQKRFWLIPKQAFLPSKKSGKTGQWRVSLKRAEGDFAAFENNFQLYPTRRPSRRGLP